MKTIIKIVLIINFISCTPKDVFNGDGVDVETKNQTNTIPIKPPPQASNRNVYKMKINTSKGVTICSGNLTVLVYTDRTLKYESQDFRCIGIPLDIGKLLAATKQPDDATVAIDGLFTGVKYFIADQSKIKPTTSTAAGLRINYNPPAFNQLPNIINDPAELFNRYRALPGGFLSQSITAITDKNVRFTGLIHAKINSINRQETIGTTLFDNVLEYERVITGFDQLPGYFASGMPSIMFRRKLERWNIRPFAQLYMNWNLKLADLLEGGFLESAAQILVGEMINIELILQSTSEL